VQSEKLPQLKPCWVRFQRRFEKSITWSKMNKLFYCMTNQRTLVRSGPITWSKTTKIRFRCAILVRYLFNSFTVWISY